jgi:hypothetical protein
MPRSKSKFAGALPNGLQRPEHGSPLHYVWELLTFERLLTGPITHLIYWAGLGLIALGGFAVVGAAVGTAVRDGSLIGALLALPLLVGGLLGMVAVALLWRGMCEFYLAVFRIADDLRILRLAAERDGPLEPPAPETLARPRAGGIEL